jgi:hypothetical protein
MRIPPSLQPFLHKRPIIAAIIWLVYGLIYVTNLVGNFQNTVEGLRIVGNILNFIFNTRAGIFAFQALGLLLIWLAVREHLKAVKEYQPQKLGTLSASAIVIVGSTSGLKFELNTSNKKGRLLEAKVPIQSAWFTKPRDKVVRPEDLPVIIECENNFWKRLKNKIVSVPTPRIIVKGFTEQGIIWDEENTNGADIIIELIAKQI